jgi:hypothetical protein
MKTVSLFGSGTRFKTSASTVTGQRRVNMYFSIRYDGEKSNVVCYGTPGLELFITLPHAPIRGWVANGQSLYVIGGSFLYLVQPSGTFIELGQFGTIDGRTNPVEMAYNDQQLMLVDGEFGYLYQFSNVQAVPQTSIQNILGNMFPGLGLIARQQGFA